jgi:hypothetical protein
VRPIADPLLLQATKKRKSRKKVETPDLHEEWAILKRLPPRGFFLDYGRIDAFALVQYSILAKSKRFGGLSYKVKFDKVLYKTPNFDNQDKWQGKGDYYERDPEDPNMGTQIWLPAHELFFTQRQVKVAIANAKAIHRHNFSYDMKRDADAIEALSRRMRYMARALDDLDGQVLPPEVVDKLPTDKPKP